MLKNDSEKFQEFIKDLSKAEEVVNKAVIETPARTIEVFQQRVKDKIDLVKVQLINKAYEYTKGEMEQATIDGAEEAERTLATVKAAVDKTNNIIVESKNIPLNTFIISNSYIELAKNITVASENAIKTVNDAISKVQAQGKLATVSMVRDTIKQTLIAENGNTFNVTYSNGHKVGVRQYSEMLARTSRISTANESMVKRTKELGRDLVICTKINATCPICRKYEGKVYSISGQDDRFPPLYNTDKSPFKNGYNIIHPNCRHEFLPFIEELHDHDMKKIIRESNKTEDIRENDLRNKQYQKDQATLRQWNIERIEYKKMQSTLGDKMPYATLGGFRRGRRGDTQGYKNAYKQMMEIKQSGDIL